MRKISYIILSTALLFAFVQVEAARSTFNRRNFPTGIVDGQKNWSVTQGTASVNTSSRYLQVDSSSSATLALASSSSTLFFSTFRVTPYAGSAPSGSVFMDMAGSKLSFVDVGGSQGEVYALDGQSDTWIPTGYKASIDGNNRASDQIFFSVRQDFSSEKEWDVSVIGHPVAPSGYPIMMGLSFVDENLTCPDALTFVGHSNSNGRVRVHKSINIDSSPLGLDSDGDGMSDEFEIAYGTDPNVNDRDGDVDGDGTSNVDEFIASFLNDTDLDGIDDAVELAYFGDLDQNQNTDFDRDGLPDGWEIQYGLNPTLSKGKNGRRGDFDGDGWRNGWEYWFGSDPSDPSSTPWNP